MDILGSLPSHILSRPDEGERDEGRHKVHLGASRTIIPYPGPFSFVSGRVAHSHHARLLGGPALFAR